MNLDKWMEQFANLGCRYESMRMALDLLNKRDGKWILETGTTRMKDDWGAGMSTVVFAEYCKAFGGHVTTVDLSPQNMDMCKEITEDKKHLITYIVSDSLFYLQQLHNVKEKVDLLYLDSYDYPYGELLDLYGGKTDINEAIRKLRSIPEDQIIEQHVNIIFPSQNHQLSEMKLAMPLLHDKSIILLDDNDLPGGGKTRLTKMYLGENGWREVVGGQQSLWIKA